MFEGREELAPPAVMTPGLVRAVEVAREVLRERGYSDEEIDLLLSRTKASEFPDF